MGNSLPLLSSSCSPAIFCVHLTELLYRQTETGATSRAREFEICCSNARVKKWLDNCRRCLLLKSQIAAFSFCYFFFLTARPWAERGSWFTRGFFNRAAMGRARFMVYPWFFFFRLRCEQTQTSTRPNFESRNLWGLLSKSCWNINKSHLLYWLSREKKLKTQRSSKIISFQQKFRSEHIPIYIRLNHRWNDLFRIFFPSGSTKTSDYKITPNPHVAKKKLFKTLTSKRYNNSAFIATTHRQAVNLFVNNPVLSC